MSRISAAILAIRQSGFYQKMTFAWLLIMGLCTLFWFLAEGGWEPVVTFAGICAAASGFILEPHFQKSQERGDVFYAVDQEIIQNSVLLQQLLMPERVFMRPDGELVYPRLSHISLDRALSSSAVSMRNQIDVWSELFHTRNEITRFNNLLCNVELVTWDSNIERTKEIDERIVSEERVKSLMALLKALRNLLRVS